MLGDEVVTPEVARLSGTIVSMEQTSIDPEPVAHLRLATWNLNHWRQPLLPTDSRKAAWDYLASEIGADVALVQEAVPPPDLGRDRAVYGEMAGHRNWGSAVVALDARVSLERVARWLPSPRTSARNAARSYIERP